LPRIVGKADAAQLGDAVGLAVNDKAVEMGVGPAEGDLEHGVEVGDRGIITDEQPAPDRRAALDQSDVELIDLHARKSVSHRVVPP
jgi:hypothetical protein